MFDKKLSILSLCECLLRLLVCAAFGFIHLGFIALLPTQEAARMRGFGKKTLLYVLEAARAASAVRR
jgi:hypothetical protein